MSPLQAALLGIIQGLTEFLPISSSAHLYAIPTLLGWTYGGLAFDVALHWGTLVALLIAFWREWWMLIRDAFSRNVATRRRALGIGLRLAVASVPAAVVGLLLQDAAETYLRALPLQAAMLIVFGFLLWWVDKVARRGPEADFPGWGACLVVGVAQSLALVPGVSRSGVTITAGRAAGMGRVSAARFSFLLATPITFGAGLVELRHASHVSAVPIAIGVMMSAIFGLIAIRGLIRWVSRAGFAAFFAYRVALAALLIFFSVTR